MRQGGGEGFEALGRWLRGLRGDMTQASLAKRLGVTTAGVCNAEHGEVSARTAERYDRHFSAIGAVEVGAIITWQNNADQARKQEEAEVRALVEAEVGRRR